jgi:uncharacterized membrane protein
LASFLAPFGIKPILLVTRLQLGITAIAAERKWRRLLHVILGDVNVYVVVKVNVSYLVVSFTQMYAVFHFLLLSNCFQLYVRSKLRSCSTASSGGALSFIISRSVGLCEFLVPLTKQIILPLVTPHPDEGEGTRI